MQKFKSRKLLLFILLIIVVILCESELIEKPECFTPTKTVPYTWLREGNKHKYRPLASKTDTFAIIKLISNIDIKNLNHQKLGKLCFKREHFFETHGKKKNVVQKYSMFGKLGKFHYNTTIENGGSSGVSWRNRGNMPDVEFYTVWKNKTNSLFLIVSCIKKYGMTWFTASESPTVSSNDKKSIQSVLKKLGFNLSTMMEFDYSIC